MNEFFSLFCFFFFEIKLRSADKTCELYIIEHANKSKYLGGGGNGKRGKFDM